MKKLLLLVSAFLGLAGPVLAANPVTYPSQETVGGAQHPDPSNSANAPALLYYWDTGTNTWTYLRGTSSGIAVTGGGGGSSQDPFTVGGTASTTVTTGGNSVNLPNATDTNVWLQNTSTVDANFKLGLTTCTAATTDALLRAGKSIILKNASGTQFDRVCGITASGTATFKIATGAGIPFAEGGGTPQALGQAAMAASAPVAIANDQSNLPMNLKAVNGTTYSLGQSVMASSMSFALASDQSNVPGNLKAINGTSYSLNADGGAPVHVMMPTIPLNGASITNNTSNVMTCDFENTPTAINTGTGSWGHCEIDGNHALLTDLFAVNGSPVDTNEGNPTLATIRTVVADGATTTSSQTANNTVLLGPYDLTGYSGVLAQITSIGGGATITWQASDMSSPSATVPGTDYSNISCTPAGQNSSTTFTTTTTGIFTCNKSGRWWRAVITAYTSGTITAFGNPTITPVVYNSLGSTQFVSVNAQANGPNIGVVPGRLNLTLAANTLVGSLVTGSKTFYGCTGETDSTTTLYLKLYSTAGTPTAGSGTPVITIPFATKTPVELNLLPIGFQISTGIGYAVTGGNGDADTTVGTGAITANCFYR